MSLLILLPVTDAGTDALYEHVVSPDGRSVTSHASVPLPLLPAGDCTVVVPITALGWHPVELPPGVARNTPRQRAVLNGLLEERLLDEPDAVHIALSPFRDAHGKFWAATCHRAWLKGHLQALESGGHRITRVVPEFEPDSDTIRLHVGGTPERPWLLAAGRGVPGGAVRVPLTPGARALLTGETPADTTMVISADPALTQLAEQALHQPVEPVQVTTRLLEAGRSEWDLAQFDLADGGYARWFRLLGRRAQDWRHAPRWKPARWGLLALLVVQLVGLNAWAWRERAELAARRQSLADMLTRTFPSVRLVVDAPVQMEREVAALRRATGSLAETDLEPTLAALGNALAGGHSVTGIEFDGRALRVQGPSEDQLPDIQSRLAARGYSASFDAGRLVVRHGGAR